MIIIPTYNRVLELDRVLGLYSDLGFDKYHFCVLDGSDIEQCKLNAANISKYSNTLKIAHIKDGCDFHIRVLNYLENLSIDNVIILANDEDVFQKDYIEDAINFLNHNDDYSAFIGKYITWQKPVLGFNRVSSWREVIIDGDISFEDPSARLSLLGKFLLAGCSPLFWGARRVGQLKESLMLQQKTYMHTTREMIDQIHLVLSGKIKFVNQNMLWRDERRQDFKAYPQRADLLNNVPLSSIPEVSNIFNNEFEGRFNQEIDHWLDWHSSNNSTGLTYNTVYYSKRYSKKSYFEPDKLISKLFFIFDKAQVVLSEILYSIAIINYEKKIGKSKFINSFLKSL
jgi:glycosyltransferase domain-containing protein